MAIMLAKTCHAFKAAGAPEDDAIAAAEELAFTATPPSLRPNLSDNERDEPAARPRPEGLSRVDLEPSGP
jgi:hypothetical protein